MDGRNNGVFSTALENAKDCSEVYSEALLDAIDIERSRESEIGVLSLVREIVEGREPAMSYQQIDEVMAPHSGWAESVLDAGDVAAVDGTFIYEPIEQMNTTSVAVASSWMTRRDSNDPAIRTTKTSVTYTTIGKDLSKSNLIEMCEELDRVRHDPSWQRTFREHCERLCAIDCGKPWTVIDGPIFTQNLVTQENGRQLLDAMCQMPNRNWLGVIKDVRTAQSVCKFIAFTLNPGEVCVVDSVKSSFVERFKRHDGTKDWVNTLMDGDYVRVVYRPNNKAFAFECKMQDVPKSLAILMSDASQTMDHELPVLLELVDAKLRASYQSGALREDLITRIKNKSYRMGIDISDERGLR